MTFPHLVSYSAYSAHYGVCTPEEIVAAAAAHGATHAGLTDRDGLYGAVKHVRACLDHGIAPILGVDLALADPARQRLIGRIVILAEGHDGGGGYGDLCALISRAHGEHRAAALGGSPHLGEVGGVGRSGLPPLPIRPHLSLADLAEAAAAGHGRFVVLLGPDSDVGRLAAARRYRRARAALAAWRAALGAHRVRVHLVDRLTHPGAPYGLSHAARLADLAAEAGVPAVLSNAARYATEDQAVTADVLDAARGLTPLGAAHHQPNGQGWLKDPAAMHRIAGRIAAAATGPVSVAGLFGATAATAQRCALSPAADLGYGTPTVPEAHLTGTRDTPVRELRGRCEAALHRIYGAEAQRTVRGPGIAATHWESPRGRMERELAVIETLGFSSYFLTVAHVSRLIGGLGIRHAARGSGVSSLVNHLLGISVVDPLEYGLVFERFLSTERSTLPDIDIDVESARRHEIYRAVLEHYGSQRVTLMSMHNGYRARGAVRDAARALGLEQATTDRIARAIWRIPAGRLREQLAHQPELAGLREEAARNPRVDLLIDLVERLDRLPRHLSMHPCGVILSNASLLRRTPVQPSGIGLPMSQYDKHDMDPMGLLKLDILGVRMQSAMAHTLEEIEHTLGHRPDLEAIDTRDEATFELIRSTQTLGCFQIESPGQRELIGKMQPREVGDLIIDISLFRPGPMHSDMVRPYLESRHGFAAPSLIHPDLAPYLRETGGVMVFHEQIINIVERMTGCGLAAADERRRTLGGPREPETEAFFRKAAAARGYPGPVIDRVWEALAAFGSFGFCKAHGAAFAIPTYQSAWLKTHYPAHFMAGVLEHDPGMYPQRLLLADARRMGVGILPVDVNRSGTSYRVEHRGSAEDAERAGNTEHAEPGRARDWAIRLPLTQVSALSAAEIGRIIAGAPYTSAADLRARARPHRPSLERLAAIGALDPAVFDGVAAPGQWAEGRREEVRRSEGQGTTSARAIPLQLALPLGAAENLHPAREGADLAATLRTELDVLSLDVSAHLMAGWAGRLADWPLTRAADLLSLRNKTEVWVAGVRVSTMTPPMKSGKRVVFVSVDDGTGCVDAAFFDDAQALSGPELFGTPMLLIRGTTRRTGPRGISVTAQQAWDLRKLMDGTETLPFTLVRPRPLAAG
ncbi:DNA polymerase III subunit alpha [Rothia kristinae]|uniref:DNA-directed DNA polymerase n=1 Tax=Rothia kristinae TaxID=37923 RepID=A0A7T4MU73_9MICC|nr:PHP domain-containing protein [Rothia kristinae]QQC59695.1 DNA polymerase III subunit alpha [Rothia kristinae]